MIDLAVGDVLEVLQNAANGWSKGRNTRTNASGWFPFAMTQEIPKPGAAAKAEESSEYYESESEEEAKPTPKQATAVQKQPVAAVAPSPKVVQKPQGAVSDLVPNAAGMWQIKQLVKEIDNIQKLYIDINQQIDQFKQTITPVVNLKLAKSAETDKLIAENDKLKAKILELDLKLMQQRANTEAAQLKTTKTANQLKLLDQENQNLQKFEADKKQLAQQCNEKILEKDKTFKQLQLIFANTGLCGEVDWRPAAAESANNRQENKKIISDEVQKLTSNYAVGDFAVKKRKSAKNRQSLQVRLEQVRSLFG
ncbi:SH3_domain-containing protein [Hexamita inflata]|uniref:SH3 domain-containing protein n=1 Tax=Hexamita inflata TaxID=28002 RepID=A0AA86PA47_9EUKA|nr:SH3 domain-containing protein [Hexamita inflata]CAI9960587.1 SH3 domain-containing protein [Hexamita inflata]CAI9973520.1 SH3 domain-containing protein [Hexamita inflata]